MNQEKSPGLWGTGAEKNVVVRYIFFLPLLGWEVKKSSVFVAAHWPGGRNEK